MNPSELRNPTNKQSFIAREWLMAGIVSLLVSLAIVSPFWWLANASGHDISFHASSWVDVAEQWRQGILFPRWTEWANYGYGEPRFIFYPPLSWLLGGALISLVPIKAVAGIFIVTAQTLAGASAFALGRNLSCRNGALIGAAFFAANPDALLIVYVRSDYAELLAMAFYPLVLLGALRLCGWLRESSEKRGQDVAIFGLSFAAVWLVNAPAGVIASYGVALLFAWAAVTEKTWQPVAWGTAGLALGFGLAAFYVIPAAYEQRWVNIGDALSSGLAPADNFLFRVINDADHNHFNQVASLMALLTMALAVIFAWRAWKSTKDTTEPKAQQRYLALRALLIVAAGSSLLMVRVTEPLWNILPKLRFVQFPWRWTSMVAVAFCACAAAAMVHRKHAWIWATAVLLVLASCAVYLGRNTWWDADDFPSIQEAVDLQQGFEGTDEYDPVGDDHTDLKQEQPRGAFLHAQAHSSGKITVQKWTTESRVLEVETDRADRVALRLLDYPAWRVTVNGKTIQPEHLAGVKAMVIPVQAGRSVVVAEFTRTTDRTIGGAISLVSAVLAGALWLGSTKKR